MAGGRLLIGTYGGMLVTTNTGNTVRQGNRDASSPTFVRISVLIWADLISAFALYVMVNYLTNVWNLSTTHAAGIINIFNGVTPALAIVFVFSVDAFLGDFYMLVLSSIAYSVGLGLLSLSTPTFFGPCSEYKEECIGHVQKVLFFTALPLIAVGMAGHMVSLAPFLDLQTQVEARSPTKAQAQAEPEPIAQAQAPAEHKTEPKAEAQAQAEPESEPKAQAPAKHETEPKAEAQDPAEVQPPATPEPETKAEAQAQAQASRLAEALAPATPEPKAEAQAEDPAEPEAQNNKIFLQIPGLIMVMLVILGGGIALPYIKPWSIRFGIPATCALTATVLFLTGSSQYKHSKPEGSPLTIALRVFVAAATKDFQQVTNFKQIYNDDDAHSTSSLRWLDKAAIKFPDQPLSKSWTLCTVREVEDTKTGIRIVPILLTISGIGLVFSLGNTYFLEQANHMDRKLGSIEIQIPVFLLFYTTFSSISHQIFIALIKCIPIPKRYYAPTGIAVGMVLSVLCCITAATVETRRLHVIRNHRLLDMSSERIPMSVFHLVPQFLLLAGVDGIMHSAIRRLLSQQVPVSMHKYLLFFVKLVLGSGTVANVFWVYVVGKVSERNDNTNWFQHTTNKSRLDRYYWTLAGLSAVNFVIYVIVASFHNYKLDDDDDDDELDDGFESY